MILYILVYFDRVFESILSLLFGFLPNPKSVFKKPYNKHTDRK